MNKSFGQKVFWLIAMIVAVLFALIMVLPRLNYADISRAEALDTIFVIVLASCMVLVQGWSCWKTYLEEKRQSQVWYERNGLAKQWAEENKRWVKVRERSATRQNPHGIMRFHLAAALVKVARQPQVRLAGGLLFGVLAAILPILGSEESLLTFGCSIAVGIFIIYYSIRLYYSRTRQDIPRDNPDTRSDDD